MATKQVLFSLAMAFLLASVSKAGKVSIKNNCDYPIWPATLTGGPNPTQLSSTGFELQPKASAAPLDLPSPWSGRFWARTRCSDSSGRFSCLTGDCGSSGVACDGKGGAPPATLVEITVAPAGGQDFYDVSNVDGFNVPVSVAPDGGFGDCKPSSCPVNVNAKCADPDLAVTDSADGATVACKSACNAFNRPEFCCTGEFNSAEKCPPTKYSDFFKNQCPQAYSYAFDDKRSTFTCSGEPDYVITFCPPAN